MAHGFHFEAIFASYARVALGKTLGTASLTDEITFRNCSPDLENHQRKKKIFHQIQNLNYGLLF